MSRIVGGTARGRRLAVPASGTRPTSERAREALFNTLRSEIELAGARVLDLFAGSGALGLEALSRGAVAAVLVDSDHGACAVIKSNAASLGLTGAQIIQQSAQTYLAGSPPEAPFDVIFADPPYALPAAEVTEVLTLAAHPSVLAASGVLVAERSAREEALTWPDGVSAIKHRRYGEAMLWYGRRE